MENENIFNKNIFYLIKTLEHIWKFWIETHKRNNTIFGVDNV